MGAEQRFGMRLGETPRDDRAPVAPLCDVACVAEVLHQIGDRRRRPIDVESRLPRRARESVSGNVGADDVIGVRGIRPEGDRIAQRLDHLEELDHAARPAVRDQEWRRAGLRRTRVEEMDLLTLRLEEPLFVRVESRLDGPPVESVAPVVRVLAHGHEIRPVAPTRVRDLVGPPDAGQSGPEILDLGIGGRKPGRAEWTRKPPGRTASGSEHRLDPTVERRPARARVRLRVWLRQPDGAAPPTAPDSARSLC